MEYAETRFSFVGLLLTGQAHPLVQVYLSPEL